MRRLAMPTLLLALMAGCDVDPPDRAPLPVGSEAITYPAGLPPKAKADTDIDNTVVVILSKKGAHAEVIGEFVDVGTRVRVVDDPGPAAKKLRDVTIRILEGTHAGKVGIIHRWCLRPIPR